jgi:hypothetical protein
MDQAADPADLVDQSAYAADTSWIDALEAMPTRDAPAVPEVRLVDYPVALGMRQRQRTTDLMRECQLIELDGQSGGPGPGESTPRRLMAFATEIYEQFGPALEGPRAELDAAFEAGRPTIEQRYPLVAGSSRVMVRFARLMEDADAFCRAGLFISLQPDPEVYALRRWTVEEFVLQYHGAEPRPWAG